MVNSKEEEEEKEKGQKQQEVERQQQQQNGGGGGGGRERGSDYRNQKHTLKKFKRVRPTKICFKRFTNSRKPFFISCEKL